MERNEIIEKLKAILFDALEEEVEVDLDTNLITDLKLNSISLLYLALGIENEFGIKLQTEDMPNLSRVGDWVDYIERKVNAK